MSEQEDQPLAPVAEAARIDVMDILRGFALLGIVLMNIEWFNRSGTDIRTFDETLVGLDHAVGWLIRAFVEGKFYKLFALLFGMGFAVMLLRAREVGRPFGAWFVRRMLVLMVIGLAHAVFLWDGDILRDYAFAGLVFLGWVYLFETRWLKRFNTPNVFLGIALAWLVAPPLIAAMAGVGYGVSSTHEEVFAQWDRELHIFTEVRRRLAEPVPETDVTLPAEAEEDTPDGELSEAEQLEKDVEFWLGEERRWIREAETEEAAFSGDSYLEATRYRIADLPGEAAGMVFFTFILLLPIFLTGYWFIASGVLRNHRQHRRLFASLAVTGLVFGTILSVAGLLMLQHPVWYISEPLWRIGFWLFNLGQLFLPMGYLGIIVILAGTRIASRLLGILSPFGRMALTNYIMQSLIMVLLFHGYAGGLYGEVSRAAQMLVVAAIVIVQIAVSAWWLGRFRFGPLEWLWRSATYMAWQPLRRT